MNRKLTTSAFLFFFMLIIFIPGSAAEFSNHITIDCEKEAGYSLIVETDNYKIYYANDDNFNYIYISANFHVSNAKLISNTFEIDMSKIHSESEFHESKLNYSGTELTEIELKAHRQTLGYQITIKLNDYTLKLSLEPEKNPETRPVIDPITAFEGILNYVASNLWIIGLFFFMLQLFIIGVFCFLRKPWVHTQKDGKLFEMEDRGRFISEEKVIKPLPLWKLRFRNGDFFSTKNFDDLKGYKDWSIGKMVHYYAHLKPVKHKLEKSEYFTQKVRKESNLAKCCYGLFRFIRAVFFWSGKVDKWASKLIIYDKEKEETVKEITLLQLEYLLKKREIRLDVEYLSSKKKGTYEKATEKNIPLHRYFHLINNLSTKKEPEEKEKKSNEDKEEIPDIKEDSVKIVGTLRQEIIKMNSLAEAINRQQTMDERISINELEELHSGIKYQDLMNLSNNRSTSVIAHSCS